MKIGLYNLEPQINNTAMMQVSHYHKQQGDQVELYNSLFDSHYAQFHINPPKDTYDIIYAFSIFNFTKKNLVHDEMIKGGTGFDIKSKLPTEIENSDLDYSIFPDCKTSYIWFSRGCIRECPFCVVREKEGVIHSVRPKNLNPNGEWITVMDNNFFANSYWMDSIEELVKWDQPVDLQGFDVRIFKPEHGEALNKLKLHKQLKFAWDNPNDDLTSKINELTQYVKPYKLMCYVLIGFDSTPREDRERVETLRSMKIDPFVMPYDKSDDYQRAYARYVNHKAVFKSVKWDDYKAKGVI